jgi:acyl-[acyl-carrier-protein]-phospholipid O-acyltransferase/long-chain-fatty-acid--[acyl-carrier-protein] ligase
LKKGEPHQLASVQFTLAGAERTPAGMAEKWEEKFKSNWLEGYGLTETAPVVSVNIPNPPDVEGQTFREFGQRHGSAGRPLPGISLRFIDPDTGEELPYGETGILKIKGANVFSGYLNDPDKTNQVLKDGWFTTGDLARLDEDGFLHIEGRQSRFSKIGGEMVPHGTVEEAVLKALGKEDSESPVLAIAGREDEAKGESLVLLTSFSCDLNEIRVRLSEAGLANLWIPKFVKQVETIPILPTGKLDLKGIQTLARE